MKPGQRFTFERAGKTHTGETVRVCDWARCAHGECWEVKLDNGKTENLPAVLLGCVPE